MQEPFPQDPIGRQICEIFSYRWQTIEAETDPNSNKPNWRTITNYPMRPRTLWAKYQDANYLVGVRFGSQTQYGVIDIDAGSPYRHEIPTIRAALETIGIVRMLETRSSWNGGLHLYLPLPEAVSTFDLATALKQCLEAQGLELKAGQLETFPNVKAWKPHWLNQFSEYNAHRLPLQPGSGSCLLDADLNPIGGDLQRFLWQWESAAKGQDMDTLRHALKIGRDNRRKRGKSPIRSHPVDAWRTDLEIEISEGWTSHGQTNQLLKAIACFGRVFERLEGEELAEYVEHIALTRPGFTRWCRHQHEISLKARVWAKAVEQYYWPLGDTAERKASYRQLLLNQNTERAKDARKRIQEAIALLRFDLPEAIAARANAIAKAAACSLHTLYKHLDLWHPASEHPQSPRCVIDQPVGVSAVPDPPSPHPSDQRDRLVNQGITHLAPPNEGCVLENLPSKKLIIRDEWGCRGEKGLSTADGED